MKFQCYPAQEAPSQGQFYMMLPLLLKLFGAGKKLVVLICVGLLLTWALRTWVWFNVMKQFMPPKVFPS